MRNQAASDQGAASASLDASRLLRRHAWARFAARGVVVFHGAEPAAHGRVGPLQSELERPR
eukprot:5440019-Pyramimonas_sp.AAC.1